MSAASFNFPPARLPENVPQLRQEVREFVAAELGPVPAQAGCNSWGRFNSEFSRKLAEKGWIGMAMPRQYGGHERSLLERYVVIEELLAAGAPVGAHWVSDRQSAANILRHGSQAMKDKWLPRLLDATAFCVIGMSEPNSGSDLASVRTRATKVEGGWRINGQKIWTTYAHLSQLMIALVRTSGDAGSRRKGLSQVLIDLDSEGISVNPIPDLRGDRHFNEVFFDDVFVPDDALLGAEGEGWKLVTSELALERSGPERYLSSFALYLELLRVAGPKPSENLSVLIGRIAARLWTLRQMSLSVTCALANGEDAATEAVIVKDMGNGFEQDLPRWVQAMLDEDIALEDDSEFATALAYLLQASPSFSLRGGTTEILRGIVARGMGLR